MNVTRRCLAWIALSWTVAHGVALAEGEPTPPAAEPDCCKGCPPPPRPPRPKPAVVAPLPAPVVCCGDCGCEHAPLTTAVTDLTKQLTACASELQKAQGEAPMDPVAGLVVGGALIALAGAWAYRSNQEAAAARALATVDGPKANAASFKALQAAFEAIEARQREHDPASDREQAWARLLDELREALADMRARM